MRFSVIIGLLLAVGSPTRAFAQENGQVEIFPAFQEIALTAGEGDQTGTITVRNGTTEHLSIALSVVDFGSLDESGGIAFLGGPSDIERRYGLASWLALERDQLEVTPGGTASISVTVENRDSLGPGGHYGAVLLRTGKPDEASVSGEAIIGVNQIFSSLFFVRKEGGALPGLQLAGWELPKTHFSVPRTAELRFQNTGNVHIVPRGIMTVEDPFGRVVARGIVNVESVLVFPESFRRIVVALRPEKRLLWPGRYSVTLATRFDGEEEFVTETRKIDIAPLPATLFLLALIGASGVLYVVRSRRRKGERKALERLPE